MHTKSIGTEATMVSRKHKLFTITNDVPGGWICVDFGINRRLALSHYTLAHGFSKPNMALRNWVLEASNNIAASSADWIELRRHTNDTSLGGNYNAKTWSVSCPDNIPYRYVRLRLIGPGQNSSSYHICVAGLEFYGTLYVVPE
jgi:hypothetical protein